MLRHIRLLIFDLDYLIFDCSALKTRSLHESLIAFADEIPQDAPLPDGIDVEAGFREHGCRWIHFLQVGLDEAQLEHLHACYRTQEENFLDAGIGGIYPALREFLVLCRKNGIMTAIGAEAGRDYLLAVSDQLGLDDFFNLAFCSEEFGMGGTEEMIEEIIGRAEVNPSETVVLGTRSEFFRAARNLDVRSIGCEWGVSQVEELSEADLTAPSPAEIRAAIAKADDLASISLS